MAKPYFDRPEWWKSPGDKIEPATNPFSSAEECREEMHRQIMISTPYGTSESEFERMMGQDLEKAAIASTASASASSISYDDIRHTQASMMEQRHETISIPSLESDSEIKRTIKGGIRLNISKHMTAADPYGTQVTRFDAEFVLKARVDFTYGDDSSNMTKYEHLTSGVEDEILKLAREIVRERKGMI